MQIEKADTYLMKASGFSSGTAQSGTPYIRVELAAEDGRTISADLYITPKTEERTAESLMHLGWTGSDFLTLPGLGSKAANVVVDWDEYNGQRKLKVKWINAGGAAVKPSEYASRMEALAKTLGAAPQSAAAKVPF